MADNTYKEAISRETKRQIPKNLRQIGKISSELKIYVEDYVKTFIRQLAETEPEGITAAVLVGEYIKNEGDRNVFIYGAIKLIDIYEEDAIVFSEDTWTSIYETIKHYFPDGEIAGWYIRKNEWTERNYELIKEVHLDNFAGRDKVLMQYDLLEKDGEFYCYESGMMVLQSGHFIYYDKNEEMQDYMIDNKQSKREEELVQDHAVREFRAMYQEKHPSEKKNQKQQTVKLMYATGAVLVMVVMAVGITAMNNYEKMKGLEEALQTISNSLSNDTIDNTPKKDSSGIFGNVNNITDNENIGNNDTVNDMKEDTSLEEETSEDGTEDAESKDNVKGENKKEDTNNDNNDVNTPEEQATENNEKSPAVTKEPKPSKTAENKPTNTPVPEEEQEALSPLFTAEQLTSYTVDKGDTLVGICKKLYGNINYMKIIQELNQIADENKIFIGQELIVPNE